ncbi:MAG: BrnA antitoxin family protein [Gemmatimonadaceae bacterium]
MRHLPDSQIDFSDIPELRDDQLAGARRAGRPPHGAAAKQLIALRVDRDLLTRLRAVASLKGVPYQTFIHRILERSMARHSPSE